jgi:hypothetical protein
METAQITEPARALRVAGTYDVIVVGGGLAGAAAAVAAARAGVSVCLLEKAFSLGGLATLGQVTVWLPLCDGYGRQVTAGLSEEMLKLSVADLDEDNATARFIGIPPAWQTNGDIEERKKSRYLTRFNPTSYLLALEKWVLDAGVELLYDTRLCALHGKDDAISHVIIENKGGRMALACGAVIDATGDADVCHLAGEPTESLDGNVLAGWFYSLQEKGLHLHAMTRPYSKDGSKNDKGAPFFRGDDPRQITEQLVGSRNMALEKIAALRANRPDEEVQIFNVPQLPCFRMTRRLAAPFAMADTHRHHWFEDTVGFISDWRKAGPVFPVPLRSLTAPGHRNLLAAGRCMSADTSVWDVTRCFPGCCVTGESAGIAAALAVRETQGDVHALPPAKVQRRVQDTGGLLDRHLLAPAPAALEDKSTFIGTL